MEDADRWATRNCTFTTTTKGVVVVAGFVDPAGLAPAIEAEIAASGERLVRPRSGSPRVAILDEGGERSYTVLGRAALSSVLPQAAELYEAVQEAAGASLDTSG